MNVRCPRFVLLVMFAAILWNGSALGCFCFDKPRKGCEGLRESDLLFTGRVIRIEPRTQKDLIDRRHLMLPPAVAAKFDSGGKLTEVEMRAALRKFLPAESARDLERLSGADIQYRFELEFWTRIAHVRVLERFHGDVGREVEIPFSSMSCDFRFQEGHEYLIDGASGSTVSRVKTGACTRTAELRDPHQLDGYRQLLSGSAPPSVFGFVTSDPGELASPFEAARPAVGVPITIRSGDRMWRTVSNDHGEYSLVLPGPGTYDLETDLHDLPEALRTRRVDLPPGQCRRVNWLAVFPCVINGRLLDADGHPVSGEEVEIRGVSPTRDPTQFSKECTGNDGAFRLSGLVAGNYRLLIRSGEVPMGREVCGSRSPWGETYYSGEAPSGEAVTIHLEPGQELVNVEFRLPPHPPEWKVEGVLQTADGNVAGMNVWLVDENAPEDRALLDGYRTGADGRFTLVGQQGRHYSIFAHYRDEGVHYHSALIPMITSDGRPLRLAVESSPATEDCEICRKYQYSGRSQNEP